MKCIHYITLGALCLAGGLQADEIDHYTAAEWKSPREGSFLYRHRAPAKVEPGTLYPLLVFLHGAGGRGSDNKGQLNDARGVQALEKNGVSSVHQSYIIAGQVPRGQKWVSVDWKTSHHRMPPVSDSMRMLFESLDAFIANPNTQIDPDRIYIMGLSMGGYGTWDAIQRRPEFFAAAVPICGGGDDTRAKSIAPLPIWAWHGDQDGAIPVSRSRDMIAALKKAGGTPKYTEVKGQGHGVWTNCWNSADLWTWLFAQKRATPKE